MSERRTLRSVVESFGENCRRVEQLMRFDKVVLDMVLLQLETLDEKTKNAWSKALNTKSLKLNPSLDVKRTIEFVQLIRTNESLKPHYETMINQALVLLVSYFGSAVRDLFITAIWHSVDIGANSVVLNAPVKAKVGDIREMTDPGAFVADWLAQGSDLSFQDMKSIGRAFEHYFGVSIDRTERENDIVLGQACRHSIVHAGGVVDDQLLRQLRGSSPRTVKPELKRNESLRFAEDEVQTIAVAMQSYLGDVGTSLRNVLKAESQSVDPVP